MKRLIILTDKKRELENHIDDITLRDKAIKEGIDSIIISWDKKFNYRKTDIVIIRSCWDYDERIEEFMHKMKDISKTSNLINNYNIISKNYNKEYLKKFRDRGVDIVPTTFVRTIKELKIEHDSEYLVLKPNISASGKDTYRVKRTDYKAILAIANKILKDKVLLIQPFIEEINTSSEYSTVVIDSKICMNMKKTPKSDGFLVHPHFGGVYKRYDYLSKSDILFVKKVIKEIDDSFVYARIDYLHDKNKRPMLLEVELIEPRLYLEENSFGLNLLINKIKKMEVRWTF